MAWSSYDREVSGLNGLKRLQACAEKDPRLAKAVERLSTPGFLWHNDPRDMNALLMEVLSLALAQLHKVRDEQIVDLLPEVPPPEPEPAPPPPVDPNMRPGDLLDEVYIAQSRPHRPQPFRVGYAQMLGRALTAEEHAHAKAYDEEHGLQLEHERLGTRVQEMPKVEQPAEKKPEPAPGVLERWGIKSRPDKG